MLGELCKTTGWTVEYAASLSPAQIKALFSAKHRIRTDRSGPKGRSGVDGVMTGEQLKSVLEGWKRSGAVAKKTKGSSICQTKQQGSAQTLPPR